MKSPQIAAVVIAVAVLAGGPALGAPPDGNPGSQAAPDGQAGQNVNAPKAGQTQVVGGNGGSGFSFDGLANPIAANGGDGGQAGSANANVTTNNGSAAVAVAVGGVAGAGGNAGANGGDGGNAGTANPNAVQTDAGSSTATAITTAGGNATATAGSMAASLAKGGAGHVIKATGAGGKGGNGASYGPSDATATTTTTGQAQATAYGRPGASGGKGDPGGLTKGSNGDGGSGGNAVAKATTANGLTATATAVAGDGGFGGNTTLPITSGNGGSGGDASATAISTRMLGNVTAVARATGGDGGTGFVTGSAGSAKTSATANAKLGVAQVTSTATAGKGQFGSADAKGSATGIGATSENTDATKSSLDKKVTVDAGTKSPPEAVPGPVLRQGEAVATIGDPLPGTGAGQQAVSRIEGLPDAQTAMLAAGGKPAVLGSLLLGGAGTPLALSTLSGGHYTAPDGTGLVGSDTNIAFVDLNLDPSVIQGGDLRLGFLDGTGSEFQSLSFAATENGAALFDVSFTNAVTAATFFDDRVIDIGDGSAGADGDVDLDFAMELTTLSPGDGFAVDFELASIDEPPPVVPVGIGAVALTWILARARFGRR